MGIVFLEECASTQTEARRLAEEGAPHGTVVMARRQTAGRGRLGREWLSVGEALTFSMVLRPQLPAEQAPRLTLLAAVAVLEGLEGLNVGLKWPNDLVSEDRKFGGLLVEAARVTRSVELAILGVGLNVEGYPPDLPATDLRSLGYLGEARSLLDALLAHLPGQDFDHALEVARTRCVTLGRQVRVDGQEGRAVGLDSEGALLLETAQGVVTVRAGDVA